MDIKELIEKAHKNAKEHGFFKNMNLGEELMFIVSEISEAAEAHRNGKRGNQELFDFLTVREYNESEAYTMCAKDTFEDELADTVIRIFSLSAEIGIDLGWYIEHKMKFNEGREYLHGKKY